MFTVLPEPKPLLTPLGKAIAWAVIDMGVDTDLVFVCIIKATGESWCWRSPQIRHEENITMGIHNTVTCEELACVSSTVATK